MIYLFAGYHWQMDGRSQDEALMAQEAGQHRDAQGKPKKSHFYNCNICEKKCKVLLPI